MKSLIQLTILACSLAIASCGSQSNKQEPSNTDTIATDTTHTIAPEIAVNPYVPVDVSPMDMSYFPTDYPKLKMAHTTETPPIARVIYSRPHLQGRHLFQGILKYGESWRLGANEATEIQLYKNATVQGKKVAAGRYMLYCIPFQDKWTIVFNSSLDSWGLTQDSTKDVIKFDVPVSNTTRHVEFFTMFFQPIDKGAELVMAWDDTEARLPLQFQ